MNHEIVYKLYPNVVTINAEIPYDANGNVVDINLDIVNTEAAKIVYMEKREIAYPTIADQLDMLWHAIDTGSLDKTSDFYLALKQVKDNYPKG